MRKPGPIWHNRLCSTGNKGGSTIRPGTAAVSGTSTDAEKVGLHGTQGEVGPQWHSTVCAKTAKWQPFPWSLRKLQFRFHPSVLFQVQVTSKQLYSNHFQSLTRLWPEWDMWERSYAQNTTMKALYRCALEVVITKPNPAHLRFIIFTYLLIINLDPNQARI